MNRTAVMQNVQDILILVDGNGRKSDVGVRAKLEGFAFCLRESWHKQRQFTGPHTLQRSYLTIPVAQ